MSGLNPQVNQNLQSLPNHILCNLFPISLIFYHPKHQIPILLMDLRLSEHMLLELQHPRVLDTDHLLLSYEVLIKVHGDVADHAQAHVVVVPELVELNQEVFVTLAFEKIGVGKDVALDGFSDFFVKLLPMLVDDQSVCVSVKFFE